MKKRGNHMMGGLFSALGRLWHGAPPPAAPATESPAVRTPPQPALTPTKSASSQPTTVNRPVESSERIATPEPAVATRPNVTAKAAEVPLTAPSISEGKESDPVLLRREVVDGALDVLAYEFSLRGDLHGNVRSGSRTVRNFIDRMLIDHIRSVNAAVLKERRIFIPFTEESLRSPAMEQLPPRSTLLLSPENPRKPADAALLARMAAMRGAGIEIWADDCSDGAWFASVADVIDGATIRLAMRMPMEISATLDTLKQNYPRIPRAAWDVTTMDEFETLREQGFQRFAGGFVTHRGQWSGNPLSPQVMCVATLINQVREDADMHEIASILRQDMAMSYKLLRYANAAARGLNHQLSSIEQALLVMGQAQLDRWLTLLMLGGGLGGNGAILEAALVRARFMELLGQSYRGGDLCEKLFVLGLFSMLDIALKVPLAEAIRPLNLPPQMQEALLEHKGVLGSFLALAEASQSGDADRVLQHAVALGLTVRKVNARHIEALTWVNAPETQSGPQPGE